MRRLSNALRALTGRPSNRAASPLYWRIATGISWVRPTAPASLTAFGLPLDSCTTTARSNAGSIPTRRPTAFREEVRAPAPRVHGEFSEQGAHRTAAARELTPAPT